MVMLDLETLSTKSNAIILVIGAIKFKSNERWPSSINDNYIKTLDTFYERIDIHSCLDQGLTKDQKTMDWWLKQEESVKYEALYNNDRLSLKKALEKFSKWFGPDKKTKIWGNGSSFDCTILKEAYYACDMQIPWDFLMERDLRTIMDLANVNMYELPKSNKHNALYDCYRQIIGYQRSEYKLLK